MNAPVVSARGLGVHFGPRRILSGVDLDLPAGSCGVLLGPNGAGKTTLVRCLATLLRPTRGTLSLFGRPAGGDAPELRRRLGLLTHAAFLYDRLSAAENLRFYGRLYGLDDLDARVPERLAAVGLARHADRRVGGFSRGMRQRLGLARATLHDPELLLLDEPYAGLDPGGEAWLDEALDARRDAGGTTVLATHRLDKARRFATCAFFIDRGRLRPLDGTGEELAGTAAASFAEAAR